MERKYALLIHRGHDEDREVFDSLKEADERGWKLTYHQDLGVSLVDFDTADLADPDDLTSFTSYGSKVSVQYWDGKPFFGFTPWDIADDLSSDTHFDFEDCQYVWHWGSDTYVSKRDMGDFDTDEVDPVALYSTEEYNGCGCGHFTDCVDDIYEQAQRVEMIRAGLLDE